MKFLFFLMEYINWIVHLKQSVIFELRFIRSSSTITCCPWSHEFIFIRALFTFTYPAQTHIAYNGVVISTKGSRTKSIKWLWQPTTNNTAAGIVCACCLRCSRDDSAKHRAACTYMRAREMKREENCPCRAFETRRDTLLVMHVELIETKNERPDDPWRMHTHTLTRSPLASSADESAHRIATPRPN